MELFVVGSRVAQLYDASSSIADSLQDSGLQSFVDPSQEDQVRRAENSRSDFTPRRLNVI